jgi:hypothetical protein
MRVSIVIQRNGEQQCRVRGMTFAIHLGGWMWVFDVIAASLGSPNLRRAAEVTRNMQTTSRETPFVNRMGPHVGSKGGVRW